MDIFVKSNKIFSNSSITFNIWSTLNIYKIFYYQKINTVLKMRIKKLIPVSITIKTVLSIYLLGYFDLLLFFIY